MNSVGIDVAKGKSMIAVMRPFGEVVATPFEVEHSITALDELADYLNGLDGETRITMEYTGVYFQPIAQHLYNAGFKVYVVNAMLVHDYSKNSLRRVKTDKKDAIKIANYGLDRWTELDEYIPAENVRLMLKTYNRQYNRYVKQRSSLKNNLISLLDQTYPGANQFFDTPPRKADGHEKWVDFVAKFWHCNLVQALSQKAFCDRYQKWCKRAGYNFSAGKADSIYLASKDLVPTMFKTDSAKLLIFQAVCQLNAISETIAAVAAEMQRLAKTLPEYAVVTSMYGVGDILGPQLIAEIGDIHRFHSKKALVAFAGIDAPPFQSGNFESPSRSISKRGSGSLRKTLFQVMSCILKSAPIDEPVFLYLDKKRAEGKHYYVYMLAGANKFLRIYYARVKAELDNLESA